jgi:hypothetical protein
VVEAKVSKEVLRALADAHPDDGSFVVSKVEIHRGWGDLVNVTIFAGAQPYGTARYGRDVRDAVERALGTERFRVRLDVSELGVRP